MTIGDALEALEIAGTSGDDLVDDVRRERENLSSFLS